MTILMAILLGWSAAAAPGDLYRCVDATGQVRFQDKPCPGGQRLGAAADGRPASDAALREWLRTLRDRTPPPVQRADPRRPAAVRSQPVPGTVDEALLARCSARFLACADGRAASTDDCVARSPACDSGRSECCPTTCTTRYSALRAIGMTVPEAMRASLLDEHRGSCAAR